MGVASVAAVGNSQEAVGAGSRDSYRCARWKHHNRALAGGGTNAEIE